MPGKLRRHTYDLVEETFDSKVPVHNEAAFEHGIRFKVKVRPDQFFKSWEVSLNSWRQLFKWSSFAGITKPH